MEKMYKVYNIDISCEEYSVDEIIVGAIDKEDLVEHLEEIALNNNLQDMFDMELIKSPYCEHRIIEVPNCYTDKPYTVLSRTFYYE